MKHAAQALRANAAPAPEVRRRAGQARPAPLAASPRYLRASVRVGGRNDPEEREAEHAAGVIAAGGCYQVHDPGGSTHLRAAGEAAPPAEAGPARAAVAASVVDPGATGRVRRAAAPDAAGASGVRAAVQPPVIDPGASGRVRRLASPAPVDPGGTANLRAMGAGEAGAVRPATPGLPALAAGAADDAAAERIARARSAAASPLTPAVRTRLQEGLGEPLDGVRVHTGPTARAAAAAIGARAYTEGERITLGHGESEHDVRLMAHEATHVVQNRRAAGIARGMPPGAGALRTEASGTAKSEVRPAEAVTAPVSAGPIRRSIVGDALDYFADKANLIPGFRLFTIVLGVNPINMAAVDRSGANILRAAVEIIPFGGLIVKALDSYGVFEKAGAWVDQQIASLKMTGAAIRDALMAFIDSLHLSDIFHPGDVWDRAKRIFTEPIDRIIAFFEALADGLIALIKDAILRPLAALAAKTRAWDLLTAVLGKNPITGDAVPRTAETLIGGFMKLIGQEAVWARIKEARALDRAWAWFQKALANLLAFVEQIPALFISTLKSFQVSDLLDLPGAFARVASAFGNFLGKFLDWAGSTVLDLLEIVFDVVSPGAFGYVKKTGAALKSILRNPLPFVGNLVKAAKLGFQNFADNILTHLKAGLIDWLTGSLPGVYIPKALTLAEFGKFALSVLGITWAQIRAKIVKALGPNGETIMTGLEAGFAIVLALLHGGAAAAWDLIKEKLTDLKDTVIDGITGFVVDTIVKKAVPKLISMFIPGAGFISAIVSIYDTIMVFVAKLAKIAAAVMAFVDSIVAIAAGQIAGAAARVEAALAGLLSLAISFLAGFLGLGNIAEKVKAVIEKVRAAVDKALDATIGWLIGKAKTLFAKLFGKKDDKTGGGGAEVKKKIATDLSGKSVKDSQEETNLLSSLFSRYSPEGLAGIRFSPSNEKLGAIDVIVSASLAERVARIDMSKPEGLKELASIAGRMTFFAGRTTIYVYYDVDHKSFGRPIVQKPGKAGHAEMWLMREFPTLMARISRDRKRLKASSDAPVPIHLDINRTPCDGCSESHLQEIIKGARGSFPDVPIALTISSASVSTGAQITTEAGVMRLLAQGVEMTSSTVWSEIKRQMVSNGIKQFDYRTETFDIDDVNEFIARAQDVQELIDSAVAKLKKAKPAPAAMGGGV